MSQPRFITRQPELDTYCADLAALGLFAFDTEFIRDETFDATLCLVQVCAAGEVVLIDPTSGLDIAPFWALVTDPAVVKIVHSGKEDFEVCLRQSGRPPRNVFDVQVAAGFVGLGYPLSLARLILLLLEQRIGKGQTLTDWLRRPLTEEQVRYAAEDVRYLPALHERLVRALGRLGRTAWAAEEFARFEDPELYRPPINERLERFKGARRLDPLGLLVLARLIDWRDQWARERNRPVRSLMRDDVLVEIARRRPRKTEDLEVLRGFHQSRNRRLVEDVLQLIEDARRAPVEERPVVEEQREETPIMRAMLDLLLAVMRAACIEREMSQELLGSTQRLRELLDFTAGITERRPALLSGWREAFIGTQLLDVLAGRVEVHATGWPDQPRIHVVTHAPDRKQATGQSAGRKRADALSDASPERAQAPQDAAAKPRAPRAAARRRPRGR